MFEGMNLSAPLLRAIEDMNFTVATEIQAAAIPLILAGGDVIGRSHTGTGKTAAFGIPAVEKIDGNLRKPQVLVLCPTRELAMQTSVEMRKFAKYKQDVKFAVVYGGQSMIDQIRQLKTANVVIGTPGRIMDHMRRKTLDLAQAKLVVLDEADEMLNMGFYEDMKTILVEVPAERQTVLFSATMPPAIMSITKEFLREPKLVEVQKGQRTLTAIDQCFYQVPSGSKIDALNLIIQSYDPKRSIVFCNTKKMVDELVLYLNENGFRSVGLHGDMKQQVRSQVMDDYKNGRIQILVATDVAARGIDVENIEAVFNFDIPLDYEYYIHRIGRTARAGKTGIAVTLATNGRQVRMMKEIANYVKSPINEQPLPSTDLISKRKHAKLTEKVKQSFSEEKLARWQPLLEELTAEGLTTEQIACTLMDMLASKDKKPVPVIKAAVSPAPFAARSSGGSRVKLYVNIGRNQRIAPNFIVSAVAKGTGLPGKAVGKIEIFDDYTSIDLSPEDAQLVMETMQNSKINNQKVTFSTTRPDAEGPRNYARLERKPKRDFKKFLPN